MYNVYVLLSLKNGKRYVGFSRKSPEERLVEHSAGCNQWTRQNGPFKLIYSKPYQNRSEALSKEKFLKSGQGRKWLDENIAL